MTAEKGEHERAPPVCESWPTPLRATLRAPPSKWAIRAFFPAGERSEPRSRTARRAPADRSPRRTAGRAASVVAVPRAFFGTFFRAERKYYPLRGGSPTTSAGVGASISPEGYAPKGLSARLLETFGHQIWPEANENCISCALGKMSAHRHRLGGPSEKTIVSSRTVVHSTCWGAITGGRIDP